MTDPVVPLFDDRGWVLWAGTIGMESPVLEVRDTMWEDTLHRELPGDGSFDLEAVLGTLDRIGGLRMVARATAPR